MEVQIITAQIGSLTSEINRLTQEIAEEDEDSEKVAMKNERYILKVRLAEMNNRRHATTTATNTAVVMDSADHDDTNASGSIGRLVIAADSSVTSATSPHTMAASAGAEVTPTETRQVEETTQLGPGPDGLGAMVAPVDAGEVAERAGGIVAGGVATPGKGDCDAAEYAGSAT
jgi:hypothetical protein